MKYGSSILGIILSLGLLFLTPIAYSDALPEFRLKAVFLYNFIAYTEWPDHHITINLCIYGDNSFENEIDALNERSVNAQQIKIHHKTDIESLLDCQVIFISSSAINDVKSILNYLDSKPILTIADSKDAVQHGVVLNMSVVNNKILFEANQQAALQNGLTLSARLLRLATKVYR